MSTKLRVFDTNVAGLDKGACVGIEPQYADLFHGSRSEQLIARSRYCEMCPVIDKCAEAARRAGPLITRGSLWGGRISAPSNRMRSPETVAAKREPRSRVKTSRYRGVSWASKEARWAAHIREGKTVHYIGNFPATPEGELAAARAWDEMATILRGANTFLNFPPEEAPVSRYRGVTWAKRDGRWVVRIRVGEKTKFVGSFPGTPEGELDAARLWDRTVVQYRGQGHEVNFPQEGTT